MNIIKIFFFKIIGPVIWLLFFAYAFTFSSLKLVEAWKRESPFLIGLYIWIILIGIYFLVLGVK